jgi:hypothetical protein
VTTPPSDKSLREDLADFFAGGPHPKPQVKAEGMERLEPFDPPAPAEVTPPADDQTGAVRKIPAPPPGVYPNIPDADYRAWNLPSYSLLAKVASDDYCDEEVHWLMEHPALPTPDMDAGTAFHLACQNPALVAERFRPLPPEIKARRGKAWEDLRDSAPDVRFLPSIDYKKIVSNAEPMARKVRANYEVGLLLDGCQFEVSFVVDLKYRAVAGDVVRRVKGRIDLWNPALKVEADFKKVRQGYASSKRFGSDAWSRGYHIQAALYADAMTILLGRDISVCEQVVPFYFITCTDALPYVVNVRDARHDQEADYGYLMMGRMAYQNALEHLYGCIESKKWPAYRDAASPDEPILRMYRPFWAA